MFENLVWFFYFWQTFSHCMWRLLLPLIQKKKKRCWIVVVVLFVCLFFAYSTDLGWCMFCVLYMYFFLILQGLALQCKIDKWNERKCWSRVKLRSFLFDIGLFLIFFGCLKICCCIVVFFRLLLFLRFWFDDWNIKIGTYDWNIVTEKKVYAIIWWLTWYVSDAGCFVAVFFFFGFG